MLYYSITKCLTRIGEWLVRRSLYLANINMWVTLISYWIEDPAGNFWCLVNNTKYLANYTNIDLLEEISFMLSVWKLVKNCQDYMLELFLQLTALYFPVGLNTIHIYNTYLWILTPPVPFRSHTIQTYPPIYLRQVLVKPHNY